MSLKKEMEEVHHIKDDFNKDETKGYVKRKIHFILSSFKKLITQGLTPKKIAVGFTLGFIIGTFPILGTHMILGVICAFLFNLNHIAVYLGVWISFPFFIVLLWPSLRLGEFIMGAANMDWERFKAGFFTMSESWDMFLKVIVEYGVSIGYTVIGWIPIIVIIGVFVYYVILFTANSVLSNKSP